MCLVIDNVDVVGGIDMIDVRDAIDVIDIICMNVYLYDCCDCNDLRD